MLDANSQIRFRECFKQTIAMPATEATPVLKCDNILVSSRGMTETMANKVVIFVPTAEIDRISLKFGRSDHRPMVSLSLGIILASVGIYGLIYLVLAPRGYRFEIAMMFFGAIGGTIIFDTLKKRYFFEVYKKSGNCRLVFSRQARLKDIQDFCDQIRTVYKYQITDDAGRRGNGDPLSAG